MCRGTRKRTQQRDETTEPTTATDDDRHRTPRTDRDPADRPTATPEDDRPGTPVGRVVTAPIRALKRAAAAIKA